VPLSVVAGAVEVVVGGAVVAVVGGAVVAVDRVVGVGRVVGDVVDGGVVVALVSVELSDPVLSVESVLPEPLFDLRPFDFLFDLLSEDFSSPSDDFLSDAATGNLAASTADSSASATPPPTDRPTTISSAPVPASA
jgi:hypothetical protein